MPLPAFAYNTCNWGLITSRSRSMDIRGCSSIWLKIIPRFGFRWLYFMQMLPLQYPGQAEQDNNSHPCILTDPKKRVSRPHHPAYHLISSVWVPPQSKHWLGLDDKCLGIKYAGNLQCTDAGAPIDQNRKVWNITILVNLSAELYFIRVAVVFTCLTETYFGREWKLSVLGPGRKSTDVVSMPRLMTVSLQRSPLVPCLLNVLASLLVQSTPRHLMTLFFAMVNHSQPI